MTLAGFKHIFSGNFTHRLPLGRLIGLVFALPLLWFAIKRRIPRAWWRWSHFSHWAGCRARSAGDVSSGLAVAPMSAMSGSPST